MLRAIMLVALALTSCDPAVDVCRQHCDKRAACDDVDIDVAQCHEACADSALSGDEDCVDAQLTLQRCQLALPCEEYLAGTGCDPDAARVVNACDTT